jgi:cytochrome c2
MPLVEKVRKLASERMSYSLFDKKDPKNMFKACPHCKLIWVKVAGCDGQTTCGRRLDGSDILDRLPSDTFSTPKFKFSWANKTFSWVKEILNFSNTNPQSKVISNSSVKAMGCGKAFVWGD